MTSINLDEQTRRLMQQRLEAIVRANSGQQRMGQRRNTAREAQRIADVLAGAISPAEYCQRLLEPRVPEPGKERK